MTPQERDLVTALLDRLTQQGIQPKDAEADALIRRALADQPDAPYYLVQTVLIQDMALRNAESRIAELERQLAQAKAAPAPQQQQPASFLRGAGSGFLRQAAATAAGIAGGALLFQGIQSLFGPHYGGGFLAGMPTQPGISETVNNYYGDQGAPGLTQADAGLDQQHADAADQDMGDADFADEDFGADDSTFDV